MNHHQTRNRTMLGIALTLFSLQPNLATAQRADGPTRQTIDPPRIEVTPEQERIRELERENLVLRQERDILKDAKHLAEQGAVEIGDYAQQQA